jgi:hypothetical protein
MNATGLSINSSFDSRLLDSYSKKFGVLNVNSFFFFLNKSTSIKTKTRYRINTKLKKA